VKRNNTKTSQYEDEDFVPRRRVSKQEMRKIRRLEAAIRSKNLTDILDLDEDLS
jgi:hypothetical protein